MKTYRDIENTLQSIQNPAQNIVHLIDIPEFTFLGVQHQPDFGHIKITMRCNDLTPELKALKAYILQFRDAIVSYERATSIIYNHFLQTYAPNELTVEIEFRPRGGISSTLTATLNPSETHQPEIYHQPGSYSTV